MNSIGSIITRLQEQYDSSNKSYKGKIMSGDKMRRTDDYWLKTRNSERRKQTKVRHDTHRREEQPDAEDQRLEDIHFANFLGSKCEDGIPYNQNYIDEPVNIVECDSYLKPEPSKNVPEEAVNDKQNESLNNDDSYILGSEDEAGWVRESETPQIQRESNCVWNMNWVYEPETQTLTGYSTFKRGHEEEEEVEEPAAKRVRSDSYEISRMEEGAQVFNQEEINFAAMVAYMKEQVALAQQMTEDELYPCDCCR
jgi:hypothetical protein